jgi:uncharacterized protein (DUF305 family)
MARRHSTSWRARPGWQQLQVAVLLAAVLVAAVIGVVLLSGLAGDAGAPRGTPLASWNTADAAYVQAMLWHEQQAQELASLVQGRTTRLELLRLARSIRTARSSDVARMAAWLHVRRPAAADDLVYLATELADRWFDGMMARTQLRTLASTSGQRFDFLFVDMLLEHHKGAIVMSDAVLADGRDAEVALLASRTITYSQRAISQLTRWRRRWAEPFLQELTPPVARSTPAYS